MSDSFKQGDAVPFCTTNNAQAFALTLAGIEPLSIQNVYTPEQLAKLQCTAREAWQNGLPGTVKYWFASTEKLRRCVEAYDAEVAKIKDPGGVGSTIDVDEADVVRIVAAVLTQRKPFTDLWKKVTPHIRIEKGGDAQRIDGDDEHHFRMMFPGFVEVSINDREKLSEMGVTA